MTLLKIWSSGRSVLGRSCFGLKYFWAEVFPGWSISGLKYFRAVVFPGWSRHWAKVLLGLKYVWGHTLKWIAIFFWMPRNQTSKNRCILVFQFFIFLERGTLIGFGVLLAKTSKMKKLTFLTNKYTKLKLRHAGLPKQNELKNASNQTVARNLKVPTIN